MVGPDFVTTLDEPGKIYPGSQPTSKKAKEIERVLMPVLNDDLTVVTDKLPIVNEATRIVGYVRIVLRSDQSIVWFSHDIWHKASIYMDIAKWHEWLRKRYDLCLFLLIKECKEAEKRCEFETQRAIRLEDLLRRIEIDDYLEPTIEPIHEVIREQFYKISIAERNYCIAKECFDDAMTYTKQMPK